MLFTIVVLTSCSDEGDQQRQLLQQTTSWIASAEMIIHARSSGQVPETFSSLAVDRCRNEVSSLLDQLKNTTLSPRQRSVLDRFDPLLAKAAEAASKNDRSEAERTLEALRQTRDELLAAPETP
ncbi:MULTISPECIES: hypothetical protein [unclassified Sinorhizobium]|uniref:hypothetical protein n=1 Tax=unclassified Sinorhizobium TaxID=2613772 RepID=UPI00352494D5